MEDFMAYSLCIAIAMRMVEGGGRGWPAIDAVCLAKVCHIRDSVMVNPLRWWIRELLSKGGVGAGEGEVFSGLSALAASSMPMEEPQGFGQFENVQQRDVALSPFHAAQIAVLYSAFQHQGPATTPWPF